MTLGRCRSWLTAVSVAALWGIALCSPSTAETPDPGRIVVKDFMFIAEFIDDQGRLHRDLGQYGR